MRQETTCVVRQASPKPDTDVEEAHTNPSGQRQTEQKEQLRAELMVPDAGHQEGKRDALKLANTRLGQCGYVEDKEDQCPQANIEGMAEETLW